MKLTHKDAEFLERLRRLMEEKDLTVELKARPAAHMVLRGNYGAKVETAFGVTRQGVRWRFNRVLNEMYVQAYCTILEVESRFGTGLRPMALAVLRDRAEMRRKALDAVGPDGTVGGVGKHED